MIDRQFQVSRHVHYTVRQSGPVLRKIGLGMLSWGFSDDNLWSNKACFLLVMVRGVVSILSLS
jgi:hypothetical protein